MFKFKRFLNWLLRRPKRGIQMIGPAGTGKTMTLAGLPGPEFENVPRREEDFRAWLRQWMDYPIIFIDGEEPVTYEPEEE